MKQARTRPACAASLPAGRAGSAAVPGNAPHGAGGCVEGGPPAAGRQADQTALSHRLDGHGLEFVGGIAASRASRATICGAKLSAAGGGIGAAAD